YVFFSFNSTASSGISTLSLHDALPISGIGDRRFESRLGAIDGLTRKDAAVDVRGRVLRQGVVGVATVQQGGDAGGSQHAVIDTIDRKSTRLNSSHVSISYAVFCLKKKK